MRPALSARLDRRWNLLRGAAEALTSRPMDVPGSFFIRAGYLHRERPSYDDAFGTPAIVWQPRVYPAAAAIATALGSPRIVDVGSGNGAKLAALHPRFELVGIDVGQNLRRAREQFPLIHWIEHDLDGPDHLELGPDMLDNATIVCADVIEHLRRPDALLTSLRTALEHAACVALSTPDRDLLWGPEHNGPPPNPSHVREWSRRELAALLASSGFEHGRLTLTQSRTGSPLRNTILAVLARDARTLRIAFDNAQEANKESGRSPGSPDRPHSAVA